MNSAANQWLKWVTELQALAQTGLTYTTNVFDIKRFERILQLCAEILADHSEIEANTLSEVFAADKGYATPKLDVRGAVFQEDKILLVREMSDGLWTVPGGYVDVNESAGEAIVREIFEESGYETKIIKMIGLYDKQKHDHPPQWPHIYKCFFLCEIIGGEAKPSIETSEVAFFAKDQLPELSIQRITSRQIARCYAHYADKLLPTEYD